MALAERGTLNGVGEGRERERERRREGQARGGRKCEESRKPLILHQPAAPSEREREGERASERGRMRMGEGKARDKRRLKIIHNSERGS